MLQIVHEYLGELFGLPKDVPEAGVGQLLFPSVRGGQLGHYDVVGRDFVTEEWREAADQMQI